MRQVKIGDFTYDIIEQLSLPERGRWKVQRIDRNAEGRIFTVIDLAHSEAAVQLRNALKRLPEDFTSIPKLVDSESTGERIRLVLTWCNGTNFATYMKRAQNGRSLTPSVWESIRRIRSLVHATGVLHRHCRVIHGDIKPANLILPSDRKSIFLIDFGSSWQIENTRGRAIGDGSDPFFSAPEVFREASIVDERADHFSIGVVLFQMLTGKLPYEGFGGKAGATVYRSEFDGSLEQPSELSPELMLLPAAIRDAINQLLAQALGLEPEGRFASTRQFADRIDSIWIQLQNAKQLRAAPQKSWFEKLLNWGNHRHQ